MLLIECSDGWYYFKERAVSWSFCFSKRALSGECLELSGYWDASRECTWQAGWDPGVKFVLLSISLEPCFSMDTGSLLGFSFSFSFYSVTFF